MKTKENRYFYIKDIDCTTTVEFATRKDLLDYMDEYIDNLQYEWFDPSDNSYEILYNDGTFDYIDSFYDGHKIKRQHIASIVNTNPCTSVVYGNFEMNEYGVVYAAFEECIDDTNILEVDRENYREVQQ